MLRRQEKLKQNVLREAQAYKKNKAEKDSQQEEIKLANIKNDTNRSCVSPTRPRSELPSKPAPSGPVKTPLQLNNPGPSKQFNLEEEKN